MPVGVDIAGSCCNYHCRNSVCIYCPLVYARQPEHCVLRKLHYVPCLYIVDINDAGDNYHFKQASGIGASSDAEFNSNIFS